MPFTNIASSFTAFLSMRVIGAEKVFLSNFLQDARVASVTSSSKQACKKISQCIDFKKARVIVEFGGGTGSLTAELLRQMRSDCRLVVFERNPRLAQVLSSRVRDRRLTILCADAFNFKPMCRAMFIEPDVIVSGIPLSLESEHSVLSFMRDCHEVLSTSGQLVPYQAWTTFCSAACRSRKWMSSFFETIKVSHIWWNIPPLTVVSGKPKCTNNSLNGTSD